MTTNPLMAHGSNSGARDIDEYCAALNRLNFVRYSGRAYYVRDVADGAGRVVRRELDRHA